MIKIVLSLFLVASLGFADESQFDFEVLAGVVAVGDGVTVVVQSGGCTQKEDFEVVVRKSENHLTEILLTRIRSDFCKRVPFLEEIHFSYEDLGVGLEEDFRIVNPISTQVIPF